MEKGREKVNKHSESFEVGSMQDQGRLEVLSQVFCCKVKVIPSE